MVVGGVALAGVALSLWLGVLAGSGRSAVRAAGVAQDMRTEILLSVSYVDVLIDARQREDQSAFEEATQLLRSKSAAIEDRLGWLREGGGPGSLERPRDAEIRGALVVFSDQWSLFRDGLDALLDGRSVMRNRAFLVDHSKVLVHSLRGISGAFQREGVRNTGCLQLLGILVAVVVLGGLGGLVALGEWRLFRPLKRMVQWMELLSAGNLPSGAQLPVEAHDEIGQLGRFSNSFVERLHEANRTKDRFLATMSHEIRTPMNGVIGFLGNLQETDLNEQQRQYVGLIDSSARALLRVINEILDFSKLTAGSMELEVVAFDLAALVDERLAVGRQLAGGKRVRVVKEIDMEGETIIRGDPTRLRQILDNLLSNAVKFTERGEVTLSVVLRQETEDDLQVAVAVSDTGIGITPEQQRTLFQAFTQAETSTTRRYGGTGLGLCIAHQLVTLMGGKLRVRSQPGEGTCFDFAFPTHRARREEQVRLSGHYRVHIPRGALRKFWALLVDDTPTNLFLMETICQSIGLPYRTATNGQEAVELAKRQRFDLVFMDIQMPVMDGYTAIREIRKLESAATTQIIALTASAFQEDVDRALGVGSTGFIAKPFERNELMLCIAEYLGIPIERELRELPEASETGEEMLVRRMYDFMREQYQISLGEIKMILVQTVADWRPLLDDITVFTKKRNWERIRAIMHRLKGQLGAIGLPRFSAVSAEINERIKAGDTEGLPDQLLAFVADLRAVFKVIEEGVTLDPNGQAPS